MLRSKSKCFIVKLPIEEDGRLFANEDAIEMLETGRWPFPDTNVLSSFPVQRNSLISDLNPHPFPGNPRFTDLLKAVGSASRSCWSAPYSTVVSRTRWRCTLNTCSDVTEVSESRAAASRSSDTTSDCGNSSDIYTRPVVTPTDGSAPALRKYIYEFQHEDFGFPRRTVNITDTQPWKNDQPSVKNSQTLSFSTPARRWHGRLSLNPQLHLPQSYLLSHIVALFVTEPGEVEGGGDVIVPPTAARAQQRL